MASPATNMMIPPMMIRFGSRPCSCVTPWLPSQVTRAATRVAIAAAITWIKNAGIRNLVRIISMYEMKPPTMNDRAMISGDPDSKAPIPALIAALPALSSHCGYLLGFLSRFSRRVSAESRSSLPS